MSEPKSLQDIRQPQSSNQVVMGFGSSQSFELMQRAARLLSSSTLVPVAYRSHKEIKSYGEVTGYEENPNALSNCVVALNMSQRMDADPLMVMQNLHIIEGRPSWSSQFIIAAINSCGRYSPLRFVLSKPGDPVEVEYTAVEWVAPPGGGKKTSQDVKKKVTVRHQTCMAWAIEKATNERLESPVVSIEMAIKEGWLTKKGSKWQTIPELMLRYRCAAFFGRLYAPELLMGLPAAEEVGDTIEAVSDGRGGYTVDLDDLRPAAKQPDPEKPTVQEEVEPTGEETTPANDPEPQPTTTRRAASVGDME